MTALYWLGLTGVMTALFWMPYVLNRFVVLGIWGSMQNPAPGDNERLAAWAQRTRHAYANAVENLAVFVTLVLVAHGLGVSTQGAVVLAAQIYFWARLVHFVVYAMGLPGLRTVAFLAGFGAQIMVALAILSAGAKALT